MSTTKEDDIQLRKETLRKEYDNLCSELELNGKDAQRILQERIRLLHNYNDLKDIATMLLAMYASRTGATLKEVYEEFNVETASM